MAQRARVVFTDDLDGSQAVGTVTFGLAGINYEIDLGKENADKLAKVLEPYIAAARKASTASTRPAKTSHPGRTPPADVRAWAKNEGIEVKAKGRVPAELIEKFQAVGQ